MIAYMMRMLTWIIAANIFALGVLIVFLINARINLKRNIKHQEIYFKAMTLARMAKTTAEAAQRLGVAEQEFIDFCKANHIETPEENVERRAREKEREDEESKRIAEEEAAWRAEQERIVEERQKAQEEEARQRKERLKKFGFR